MDISGGTADHSRWFHPSMYLYQDSNSVLPSGLSHQSYSNESPGGGTGGGGGGGHYYSHPDSGSGHNSSVSDMNRSSVNSHSSSFHPLCHPVSPHSPPTNTSEGNTNCASRLYLPNGCPNRSSNLNLHTPNPCGNSSTSMWQHMSSIGSGATLSLPHFSSSAHSHMMKQEHPKDSSIPPVIDVSPHYNPDDIKFKLSQNVLSQTYSGFPPQLYPPHMAGGEFVGNGIPFDMLPGLPRCRTISRSNSGKCLLTYLLYFISFLSLFYCLIPSNMSALWSC